MWQRTQVRWAFSAAVLLLIVMQAGVLIRQETGERDRRIALTDETIDRDLAMALTDAMAYATPIPVEAEKKVESIENVEAAETETLLASRPMGAERSEAVPEIAGAGAEVETRDIEAFESPVDPELGEDAVLADEEPLTRSIDEMLAAASPTPASVGHVIHKGMRETRKPGERVLTTAPTSYNSPVAMRIVLAAPKTRTDRHRAAPSRVMRVIEGLREQPTQPTTPAFTERETGVRAKQEATPPVPDLRQIEIAVAKVGGSILSRVPVKNKPNFYEIECAMTPPQLGQFMRELERMGLLPKGTSEKTTGTLVGQTPPPTPTEPYYEVTQGHPLLSEANRAKAKKPSDTPAAPAEQKLKVNLIIEHHPLRHERQ